jgi:hypothetical protein
MFQKGLSYINSATDNLTTQNFTSSRSLQSKIISDMYISGICPAALFSSHFLPVLFRHKTEFRTTNEPAGHGECSVKWQVIRSTHCLSPLFLVSTVTWHSVMRRYILSQTALLAVKLYLIVPPLRPPFFKHPSDTKTLARHAAITKQNQVNIR